MVVYGLFLSKSSAKTIPTIAIAIIMPVTAGAKYLSAIDDKGASVGEGVAGTESTANEVTACDGQYDSEPAKEA